MFVINHCERFGVMGRSKFLFLICIVCMLTGSGCATIVNGGPDAVFIQSDPVGAKVLVDGNYVGLTPVTTMVSRGAKIVSFSKEGYRAVSVPLQKSFNGWVIGNIFLGYFFLPGLLIDGVAGNFSEINPFLAASLPKAESGGVQGANGPDSIAAWLGRLREYAQLAQADPPGQK